MDALGLIKKALKKPFDPHTRWFNCLEEMKMMWAFGVLEPLGMALGQKEDEGTHTHMMVIGHLDLMYDEPRVCENRCSCKED